MKNLERVTTSHLLKFYEIKVPLTTHPSQYGDARLEAMAKETVSYIKERQSLLNYLKNFRRHANNIVPYKDLEMKYYKNFATFLEKYEC